jgi:hypothetical protein
MALPLAVGIAIGRVGCFLTGLSDGTFGTPSPLPWAVDFGDGIRRHPTQLYEIVVLASIGWVLVVIQRRAHRPGDLFKVSMVGYMAGRLVLDAIKLEVRVALGLSSLQWTTLAVLLYYAHELFATNHSPQSSTTSLRDLLCCLPHINAPAELGYQNLFRIIIRQFIDAHAVDVRSVGDVVLAPIATRREPSKGGRAEGHHREALGLADARGMQPLLAHCLRALGTLHARTGRRAQARGELSTAIQKYRSMAMTLWLPEAEASLARIV